MASYSFKVDTQPMAEEIGGVNKSVGLVGAAVTAMQAAVIASERKAADDICKSIDNGFYLLMRSRLSQRVAQFSSIMNSRVSSMMETASSIARTHEQMRGDFNRIKTRYVKLFGRLDRELDRRVRELDRDAMQLAHIRDALLGGQQCQKAPAALYLTSDTSQVALKTSSARLKARSWDSICELDTGVRHIIGYERATSSIYERGTVSGSPYECIPVVYASLENLAVPQAYALEMQMPDVLGPKTQAKLAADIRSRKDLLEGAGAQEYETIRAAFSLKIANNHVDARVAKTMFALFEASSPAQMGGAR